VSGTLSVFDDGPDDLAPQRPREIVAHVVEDE
jgi:hypothetical protein